MENALYDFYSLVDVFQKTHSFATLTRSFSDTPQLVNKIVRAHFPWRLVYVQHFKPRWCIGIGIGISIGIGIGRGKSLTCITAVESMTSPIVKT